jgi:hypothetical protein
VSVSATSTCIYERFYLSPVLLAHPPVSARAPVDNAIEASIEAIEAICRERCLVVLRTEIQYQNNAGGRHGAELTCREGVKLDLFPSVQQ